MFGILIVTLLLLIKLTFSDSDSSIPTNFADPSSQATNEPFAYDNDTTTNATHDMGDDANVDYFDFNITNHGASEIINDLNLTFDIEVIGTGDDQWGLQYSDDGGNNWYVLRSTLTGDQARNNLTYSVPEQSGGEDLTWTWAEIETDLRARVVINRLTGRDGAELFLYEVWIEVDYNLADTSPPLVSLITPGDDTFSTNADNTFTYYVNDATGIENCSLIFDSTINTTNISSQITNGDNNQFDVKDMYDGFWNWSVNCTDNSTNYNENKSFNWILKLDTTPPNISLEWPANNTLNDTSNTVWFFYNVTDNMTTVASCSLIIDGIVDQSTPPGLVDEGVRHNFTTTLSNGQYNWSVNCTDSNSWEGASEIRNITINVAGPNIDTDKNDYEQGETVVITGESWDAEVNVTLNLTWANGTNEMWNVSSDAGGAFTDNYFINYSYPLGQYNLTAFEPSDPGKNFTINFNVIARTVTISSDNDIYKQGEFAWIFGTGYSPGSVINITVIYENGQDSYLRGSNSTGGVNMTYNVSYSGILGLYNITAYDTKYRNLNDTSNFTVELRPANITLDKSEYVQYENVTINGTWFTLNGTVKITINDIDSGGIALGYPLDVLADFTGNFTLQWNASDACVGNYSVYAEDLNNSNLNDIEYFNITGQSFESFKTPDSITEGDGDPTALSNVNVSDDIREDLALSNNEADYFEINFSNNIPAGSQISSVIFNIEHYATAGKVTFENLTWFNGTGYQLMSCPGIGSPASDLNETCDLSGDINTIQKAGNVSIRVTYLKATGTSDAYIDYLFLNTTYTGQPSCSPFGNVAPSVDSVLIYPSPIDLLAATYATIYCNATVTDQNGASDITAVNATFYHIETANPESQDDNNDHYTNTSCTNMSQSGNSVEFSCTIDVWYYANNGSWNCNVTAVDDGNLTSTLETSETINPLYAINISMSAIDYGALAPAETTSNPNEVVVNVTNEGNSDINLSVYGYGTVASDGLSMNCTMYNITIGNERYDILPARDFDTLMIPLTNDPLPSGIPGLRIFQRVDDIDSLLINSTNSTYWKLRMPQVVGGKCNGTVVFSAVA